MKESYRYIYKCRLCGEKFSKGLIDDKSIAIKVMISSEPKTMTHTCEDESYGVADFIGLRKEVE